MTCPSGPAECIVRRQHYTLRILTTPSCWIRTYPSCPHISRFINAALDRGDVPKRLDEHYIKLAGVRFWARNFPYAYANNADAMPDRATVFRLADTVGYTKDADVSASASKVKLGEQPSFRDLAERARMRRTIKIVATLLHNSPAEDDFVQAARILLEENEHNAELRREEL